MKLKIIVVFFVLILGVILRFHNYDVYPQRGATSDEYTYSFLGVSLLTKGTPISWSHFDYPNKKIVTIDKIIFPIVSPYFDHPPLFGILVGGWSLLFGQNEFDEIKLQTIRLIPFFLSLVSSILLFLLSNKLYGYKVAVWSLIIYSTSVVFVMNNRVVMSETLLTPLLLIALYILASFLRKLNVRMAVVLGIISGLGVLTKMFGIAIFLSIILLMLLEKSKSKLIFIISGIFLLFVSLLLLYGWYYDWNLFLEIQKAQGARLIGPDSLWLFTLSATIVNKIFQDGWYYFGLLSLFFLFTDYKNHKFIIIPSFIYILILVFSLNRTGHSGWYMIPLFPLMCMAIAYVVNQSIKSWQWIIFIFLFMIGMTEIKSIYEEWFGLTNFTYRLLLLIIFLPFILAFVFKWEKLFLFLSNTWFYIFILGNIILTYNYIHPA